MIMKVYTDSPCLLREERDTHKQCVLKEMVIVFCPWQTMLFCPDDVKFPLANHDKQCILQEMIIVFCPDDIIKSPLIIHDKQCILQEVVIVFCADDIVKFPLTIHDTQCILQEVVIVFCADAVQAEGSEWEVARTGTGSNGHGAETDHGAAEESWLGWCSGDLRLYGAKC